MQITTNGFARKTSPCWWTIVLFLLTAVAPKVGEAQVRQTSRNDRDTLPAAVARRAIQAYNRNDVPAYYANFDSVFVHESLGDTTKRFTGTPAQVYGSLPEDFAKNKIRAELKQQIVNGPFVVVLYDFIQNGKRSPHLDIYEVRHGKIVHEWEP